jgi:hypothetical protein
MNTEDLVDVLNSQTQLMSGWEFTFIYSINSQINEGIALTEKQNNVVLTILKKYATKLTQLTQQDVMKFIENPTHRLGIRNTIQSRKLDIVEDACYGKIIKIKFPYQASRIKMIQEYQHSAMDFTHVLYDANECTWEFSLNEKNIEFLIKLMAKEKFQVPAEFVEYVSQIDQIHDSLEKHVPMLCLENGKPVLKNCAKSVPNISTDNVLEAVFLARRYGITTYDTAINNIVNSNRVTPAVRVFLNSGYMDQLTLNPENHDFSSIADIVKYMSPCLIVIPGGSEYEKIKDSYQWLTQMGIQSQEMSVMFRLPRETGEKFNNLVKNHGLNSPIGNHTKIVFVSGKLAKPVVKSKIKFHCVINLGYDNAHHTMRNFLKNHENTIFYSKRIVKHRSYIGNL